MINIVIKVSLFYGFNIHKQNNNTKQVHSTLFKKLIIEIKTIL